MVIGIFSTWLAACSGGGEENSGQMDYEQTKKMIVDILKTDDGKKAIEEILTEEKMKQQLIMDQAIVQSTIETTLTSEKGTEFWQKRFEDPKFAETMSKSMKKENEQLLKDLLKDPEYMELMINVMKDPEFEKTIMDALKSKEYREHLQTVVTETLNLPTTQVRMQEIVLKAAEEMAKSGESGGGSGGGGSSEEGGSEEKGAGQEGGSSEEGGGSGGG
ncbi:spore gernimation protein GerD [Mangrovibacillus cuniculi]|uniref:Spore gernimation protein GerD n=2 Tax=Mangrovibacillus cuniculi TaxID=2593652 RepID=A0A7S8CEJ9_9BACI|nr:spore gernimation protein GerD [Mangrovibacillus cuniculi]